MSAIDGIKITSLDVKDIRWPTSLKSDGSDAMHVDPDYSCAYVTITTSNSTYGNGLTFTCGRGTEVIVASVQSMSYLVVGQELSNIFNNFGPFWRSLTSESQLRWIGPEKGVTHLAVAAIINALWDLWGKLEKKPVWRLLTDMSPEFLISTIDFRYITDMVTPEQALQLLNDKQKTKQERIDFLIKNGYPAYTTAIGWLGYTDEKIRSLCQEYLKKGFTGFKIKVGQNIDQDIKRCKLVREEIGWENHLMVDANQVWDVKEAVAWMEKLVEFKPLWIEEPTSPDDVLGHQYIAKALKKYNIGVATGEMCANRVMFKQFIDAEALEFCQIDSARIGGINEILSVYLMAQIRGVKVCPHAGGVGLCEMVQHLQMWDYTSLSGTMDDRVVEFVDQQHEQFIHPTVVENARYMAPTAPGYNTELKPEAIKMYEYPNGTEWQRMFKEKIFKH